MPHALTIRQKRGKPGQVYYPLHLNLVPKPSPGPHELLVKIHAAALNHRDVFIRQHLYPDVSFKNPLLSDGYGKVVKLGPGCTRNDVLDKPVLLTPFRGWDDTSPKGPGPDTYSKFGAIGGVDTHGVDNLGTAQSYVLVHEAKVELCPEHLSPVEAAAIPTCGLTGWRALVVKSGNSNPGHNILVTGIGGGVALQVMQFAVSMGCSVYVTSGSDDKILKAQNLGAKGGVLYKNDDWPRHLASILPAERPYLDAVIDGAGNDIVVIKTMQLLKPGGVISCYGMTVAPVMDWPMQAVLKNIELKGSTLGSRTEFADMVNFIREKKIRSIISRTVRGLDCVDAIDGLFEDLRHGRQFGKLVIEI